MQTLFHASILLLSSLYTVLLIAYARIFARGVDGVARIARPLLLGTVGLHFLSIVLRGVLLGACPLGSAVEFLWLVAFSIGAIYAVLELRIGERTTGVFAMTPTFILQLIAMAQLLGKDSPPEAKMGIARALQSFAEIVAFSAVAICGVYGLLYLVLYGVIKAGKFGLFYRRMPSLEKLSDLNFVANWLAFLGLTVLAGVDLWIYRGSLGVAPAGGPGAAPAVGIVEVAATLVLWFVFGGAIVARKAFGLGGKRLAYTTVAGLMLLLASIALGMQSKPFIR